MANNVAIGEALTLGAKRLIPCSSSPRLDSEVLLGFVLGMGRASLLARSTDPLDSSAWERFNMLLERRTHGEPIAYITGHKEFFGLDLLVTKDVLVPRPETESLVEACLELLPIERKSQLADIGTGSGAILVALGVKLLHAELYGTEISAEALSTAQANVERHGIGERVHLLLGSLFEPLEGLRFDLIAANLPYVPPGEAEPDVATWEPKVAVFGGGDDGTATIREFLAAAPTHLVPGGAIVMETAYSQGQQVSQLARLAFPGAAVEIRKDLAGYDRIVIIKT